MLNVLDQKLQKMSLKGLCTNPKKLPYLILHKIMSYDIRCQSNLMRPVTQEMGLDESESDLSEEYSSEESDDEVSFNPDQLHPVDCLIALLLCCDCSGLEESPNGEKDLNNLIHKLVHTCSHLFIKLL